MFINKFHLTAFLPVLLFAQLCHASTTSVSISGLCAPAQSATSAQGDPVGVSDPQKTCPEGGLADYATESVSASYNGHSFSSRGSGITGDLSTFVQTLASYTETDLVTGPEQGAGVLSLLFDVSLTLEWGPGAAVSEQLASSVGTGGFQITCYSFSWQSICPGSGSTDQYQATLEIPFTYGVPFTYTVSFDTGGGAGGGSFIYSGGAGLVSASTGNPQDIVTEPNPVPELPTWECLLVGIGAVGLVKRVIAGRAV